MRNYGVKANILQRKISFKLLLIYFIYHDLNSFKGIRVLRIIFLLFLSLSYSYASIVITDEQKRYTHFSLAYLYDESNTLTIENIAKTNFTHTIPNQFALGYKDGTAWFKLIITNQSKNSDFILYFTEPFWSDFDLFEPTNQGWKQHQNGLINPLKKREIEDNSPAFFLNIKYGESKTYFIKGRTINSHIGAFKLYTEHEFFRPSRFTLNTFYLFYSGVLFIIILLNIFLYFEMKERLYGYYIGYVSSFIVFISMFSGSYLSFGLNGWPEGLHTLGTPVMAFMTLFSSEFLQLKKYLPKLHAVIKISAVILIVFAILINEHVPHINLIFNIFSIFLLGLLFGVAIWMWLRGLIQTRYYLVALIIYMPLMGLMVLTFNTLIPNCDFTRYSFLFGSLVEIILFSLILAKRFHKAKYGEICLQKKLLIEKRKNLATLNNEIKKQSQEIKEKNALLFHQSRNAAMGEMISMIAHQWRQPLNTLGIINQDLYFKYKMGLCDESYFKKSHEQFDEHLQYMSSTIDDFRNYYKDGKAKQPEDIEQIVVLALRMSEVFLNCARIKTEMIVLTHQKVSLAKNGLLHVLINLIKNAHDVILERNIQHGHIKLIIKELSQSIVIHICDNAGGIPDEIAPKIFEPYFSTKSDEGTGLGLYMSKSIIEDHCHGTLSFYNSDVGVCFTITLPLNLATS